MAISNDSKSKVQEWPPGAKALIDKSKELLTQGGVDALRISRIVRAAGQNQAMVNYYFGSKAALLEAVAESLMDDILAEEKRKADALPRGPERIDANVEAALVLMRSPESLATLDLVPVARHNDDMRLRLARLYHEWRLKTAECLDPDAESGSDAADVNMLAAVFLAVVDGLCIQWLLDPEALDFDKASDLLKDIFKYVLYERGAGQTSG